MKFTQEDVVAFLGYDLEITTLNGNAVERFYLDSACNNRIVFSSVLYAGDDAAEKFVEYFEPQKRWYFCGNELRCTVG